MSLFSNLKLDTFYPSSKSHSLCPQIQDIKKTFSSLFRCVYISPMFVIHLRNFVISKSFFHSPLQPSSHPLSSSCYVLCVLLHIQTQEQHDHISQAEKELSFKDGIYSQFHFIPSLFFITMMIIISLKPHHQPQSSIHISPASSSPDPLILQLYYNVILWLSLSQSLQPPPLPLVSFQFSSSPYQIAHKKTNGKCFRQNIR